MTPFVHKFETDQFKYVYDVNSNRVFKVSEVTYEIIDQYQDNNVSELAQLYPQFDKRDLKKACREIRKARKKDNIFCSDRPSRMAFYGDHPVEDLITSRPHEQLILNVTERCNLRCRYCAYSGLYPQMRKHSTKDMSFNTARVALHKFLHNCDEECAISFYGGEPLLNLDLVKLVVAEAESHYDGKFFLSMTTNGTLLDPESMDYLREKNFFLLVSLDGPQEVHDSHRVYNDGRGSFEQLMRNLEQLQARHTEYYDEMVSFSTVSIPPGRLKEVKNFFSTEPLVKNHMVQFTYVEGIDDLLKSLIKEEDILQARIDSITLRDEYLCEMKQANSPCAFLDSLFQKSLARFYRRPKTFLGPRIELNGCCIPGSRRIFVTADGVLYVCERLDSAYPIGSVEHWIEPELVGKLVNDYLDASKDCLSCWACRICSECFAQLFRLPDWSDPTRRRETCERNRRDLHRMLINYYSIVEDNPSALDVLDNVTFS